MDHAVDAAGQHDVDISEADQLGRLADGLGAGRAGREARHIRAPGPEGGREVPGRGPGLLLGFEERVEEALPQTGELPSIDLAPVR
jgi:hypothetical protein